MKSLTCFTWAGALGHALAFARITGRRQRVVRIGRFWTVTAIGDTVTWEGDDS